MYVAYRSEPAGEKKKKKEEKLGKKKSLPDNM